MKIILMMSYVRSGGTLLNRCLGSLPDTVVLSEVHRVWGGGSRQDPKGVDAVITQARDWYSYELASTDFYDALLELGQKCAENDKHLVVREYTLSNYYYPNENSYPEVYETLHRLRDEADEPFDVVSFALVRNLIDAWISWQHPMEQLEQFFLGYRMFVEHMLERDIRAFHYEDLCANPDRFMKELCDHTGLPFDENYRNFYRFTAAQGDLNFDGGKSRGTNQKEIRIFPRKYIPSETAARIDANPDMQAANQLLGYGTYYNDPTLKLETKSQAKQRETRKRRRKTIERLSKYRSPKEVLAFVQRRLGKSQEAH